MTLAMDLRRRGLRPVVIEKRAQGKDYSLKCNHISARTMEAFRLLGIVKDVRNAGLPEDYAHDVAFRTSFLGHELWRIPIPCRRDRYTATDGPDCGWPTPEPPHRMNQSFLEPILARHLVETFGIETRYQTTLKSVVQDSQFVTAVAEDKHGNELRIACRYLIGCDGPRSTARSAIGAKLEGDPVVLRVQSTFINAPKLLPALRRKGNVPAWGTMVFNPQRSGNVYAIDGRDRWLVFNYLRPDESGFDAVDRDWGVRTILGLDDSIGYEIISTQDWTGRRLIADRFRDRRIFLCGDAAHIWVPYAGYGMNAGIADAMNLSWLLSAHLSGWAPAAILDAYEAERQPITEQVSRFAMAHSNAATAQRLRVPDQIEDSGAEGERLRREAGQAAYDLNVAQYCCAGLNFGYYYDKSPIIAYDDEQAPVYTMDQFTPTTVPGTRLPHIWLSDGRSLHDALGPGYTLLYTSGDEEAKAAQAAAARIGMPMEVLKLNENLPPAFKTRFILVRPDQHIAWRGSDLADVTDLLDHLRGVHAVNRTHRTDQFALLSTAPAGGVEHPRHRLGSGRWPDGGGESASPLLAQSQVR
ncbi:FAD-dependent monooxygenase [Bradyrhizobium sp. 200]|nr:FAD-dependent monooxygenase [Bradyrhizobium sp. 200]